jgi:hypothetical protein
LRTIIVHYHIFKNAGSSIDRILKTSFAERWASLEGDTATSLLRPHDLSVFVRDRPEIVAVSSHLLRPPGPAELHVLPVVLIRDPLDRAFSVYSQLRRNTAGVLANEVVAQRGSFSQFVLWCMSNRSHGGMVIANYQVIHLSPASFRSEHIYNATATEDDLQAAICYLSDGACWGTVDRFDAAVARLRQAAGAVNLDIPSALVAENTTAGRPNHLQERLSAAREHLGHALHERFRQENELDYRLYEWASAVSEAISSVPA